MKYELRNFVTLMRVSQMPGDVHLTSSLNGSLGVSLRHPARRRGASIVQKVERQISRLGELKSDVAGHVKGEKEKK